MADESQQCDAWQTLAIDEFVNATFFCERPMGHSGPHIAHDQNGVEQVEWTDQPAEPTP
jgi:hypothetical protein